MKIGVISDTHIRSKQEELPAGVLLEFKKLDMVIHAGDLVDLSVLEKLEAVCQDVRGVCGNMDSFEVRSKLPEKQIIQAGKHRIGVMHGYGAPNKLIDILNKSFANDSVDIIIFGHSHTPLNEKRGNILYFNPGSLTDKTFAPYNSYGIIETNDIVQARIIKI